MWKRNMNSSNFHIWCNQKSSVLRLRPNRMWCILIFPFFIGRADFVFREFHFICSEKTKRMNNRNNNKNGTRLEHRIQVIVHFTMYFCTHKHSLTHSVECFVCGTSFFSPVFWWNSLHELWTNNCHAVTSGLFTAFVYFNFYACFVPWLIFFFFCFNCAVLYIFVQSPGGDGACEKRKTKPRQGVKNDKKWTSLPTINYWLTAFTTRTPTNFLFFFIHSRRLCPISLATI